MSLVNGNMSTGMVEAIFTTKHHTGVMIPVFAFGSGVEKFSGIYDNNTIFDRILESFRFKRRR
jgi:alkaline phosphatase